MPVIRLVCSSYTLNSYSTLTNESNLYNNTDSETYSRLTYTRESTYSATILQMRFNVLEVPSDVNVTSALWKVKYNPNPDNIKAMNGRVYVTSAYGNTMVKAAGIRTYSRSILVNIGAGYTWSDIVDNESRFYTAILLSKTTANIDAYIDIYGIELEVTYELPASNKLYFKSAGSWVEASKAYKKTNGVWVEQTDLTTVFDSSTNYVKGN